MSTMRGWMIVGLVVAGACGGGSGGGDTNAVTPEEAEPLCTQGCQHQITCGSSSTLEECVADCVGDVTGWVREDAMRDVIECIDATPCDQPDDACLFDVEPLPIHQLWEDRCRVQLATCLSSTELEQMCEVSGTEANLFKLVAPAIMDEFIACLDQPDCTTRLGCVQNVASTHGIDF